MPAMISFKPPFFFSSRRRHTRCLSDWSSDVCSSDLEPEHRDDAEQQRGVDAVFELAQPRSEERRVGKECRYRWRQYPEKKRADTISIRSLTAELHRIGHGFPTPIRS